MKFMTLLCSATIIFSNIIHSAQTPPPTPKITKNQLEWTLTTSDNLQPKVTSQISSFFNIITTLLQQNNCPEMSIESYNLSNCKMLKINLTPWGQVQHTYITYTLKIVEPGQYHPYHQSIFGFPSCETIPSPIGLKPCTAANLSALIIQHAPRAVSIETFSAIVHCITTGKITVGFGVIEIEDTTNKLYRPIKHFTLEELEQESAHDTLD